MTTPDTTPAAGVTAAVAPAIDPNLLNAALAAIASNPAIFAAAQAQATAAGVAAAAPEPRPIWSANRLLREIITHCRWHSEEQIRDAIAAAAEHFPAPDGAE